MAFFRNTTVNLLNLHYGIHALALGGGGAFFAAFLLKAGVPAHAVLLSMAVILIGRFIVRPLILPLGRRFGLKPLLIVGTVITSLQYPLLAEVEGVGWPLVVLCAFSSVGDTLYWTAYHAYFAAQGDAEHRGHQVSAREAASAMVGIAAPLLTGWALVTVGPRVAFGVTCATLMLAAIPLFWTPNVAVPEKAPGALRAAMMGVLLFAADGWAGMGYLFVWQIALFISLKESFTAFGGAMALAAAVGAVSGLVLGRFIDAGHGRRAVWLSCGVMAAAILARTVAWQHPATAVLANAAGAVVAALYTPTMMTAVYNLSKRSPCVLRFHIAAEGGYDTGAASACLLGGYLIWAGAPLSAAIAASLIGTAAAFALLRKVYGTEQSAATPQIT